MYQEQENGIQEITIDTVRELKNRGLRFEASEVIKAFHINNMKQKRQLKNELIRYDRMKRIAMGICVACKIPALSGNTYCKRHLLYQRNCSKIYYRQNYAKKKI